MFTILPSAKIGAAGGMGVLRYPHRTTVRHSAPGTLMTCSTSKRQHLNVGIEV